MIAVQHFANGVAHAAHAERRTVYVIDDEARVRFAVVHMLEDIGVAAWAFASATDFFDAVDTLEPGCLLLDVQMDDMNGIEMLKHLNERRIEWPVIIMTAHGDIPLAVKAMKLGAMEFIEKPFAKLVLEQASERGFTRLEDAKRRRVTRDAAADRLKPLSPREQSVLNALIEGKQNKVIAFELGLSVRTVEMHRSNLLHKVGVQTLQEVISIIAHANGFGTEALSIK